MGYMTDGLTFNTLRIANKERLPEFKNKHGKPAHSKADGSDWSDAQWLQAVVGELGEYANLRKKLDRGDIIGEEAKQEMADELADTVIYLDLLAFRLGISLGDAVMRKWNRVSQRVGSTLYIDAEGVHRHT
jgi:NTP pyrophosphatase (non-canonical NTP hydrolase)